MRSSKSRSRSKQNRPRSIGNIINRVFDSSGPEGKVRGTPQQIIEKYLVLARDAQLSNDRVAAENFLQHAEHYTRMLGEAQRELAAEQDQRRGPPGSPDQRDRNGNGNAPRGRDDRDGDITDSGSLVPVFPLDEAGDDRDSGLVETPEARREPRNPQGEAARPRDDRQQDRSRDNRPRGDRQQDRPRDDRPQDRSQDRRDDRSGEDRAQDDRSRDDRPRDERPRDERPREDPRSVSAPAKAGEAAAKPAPKPRQPRAPRNPSPAPEATATTTDATAPEAAKPTARRTRKPKPPADGSEPKASAAE